MKSRVSEPLLYTIKRSSHFYSLTPKVRTHVIGQVSSLMPSCDSLCQRNSLTLVQILSCTYSYICISKERLLRPQYMGPLGRLSYDQRSGVSGESWADPEVFEGRAHYLAHLNPPAMLIMRTTVSDAHVYRCRVDFHNSNSRVAWVRLRVIVPPSRVEIATQVSPVMPGQRDDVVCTAVGGDPPPSVVWLQNGKVVDPNSTVGERGTFNSLEVVATREDLNFPFTCKATNNDVTAPVFAIYYRNVTCGPTNVQIEASESPLVEAREAELTCTAVGSNPPAHLTWYQQGKNIEDVYVNVTRQDNVTVSVLSLIPGRRHHDRQLLCRAENPSLPMATMEDMITLNVAYRPVTRLEVGWPQRPDLMTEGSDLYLECIVDANPHPYKVKFFHNGEEMVHNETAGVEVRTATTTYTVALQRVTRRNSGVYQCLASNVEGDAYSANLTIKIKSFTKHKQRLGPSERSLSFIFTQRSSHSADETFSRAFNRRQTIAQAHERCCVAVTRKSL
ncbi:nephrin-like [Penaeus chinensis]|uniref:nephrin-like n=1 Tax=Penaeus chinensis TaxID=139456 RepID=UPI001FB5A81A|nr:nephrin-like [Penaeus chinensis]